MKTRFFISAISLLLALCAEAQISNRPVSPERQNQARDTSLERKTQIERKYDSLIHQCENELLALNFHILQLQKDVEAAKTQLKELEESQKGVRANQNMPKSELEQKMSDTNKKINALLMEMKNRLAEADLLKQKISLLEKAKQEALKKL